MLHPLTEETFKQVDAALVEDQKAGLSREESMAELRSRNPELHDAYTKARLHRTREAYHRDLQKVDVMRSFQELASTPSVANPSRSLAQEYVPQGYREFKGQPGEFGRLKVRARRSVFERMQPGVPSEASSLASRLLGRPVSEKELGEKRASLEAEPFSAFLGGFGETVLDPATRLTSALVEGGPTILPRNSTDVPRAAAATELLRKHHPLYGAAQRLTGLQKAMAEEAKKPSQIVGAGTGRLAGSLVEMLAGAPLAEALIPERVGASLISRLARSGAKMPLLTPLTTMTHPETIPASIGFGAPFGFLGAERKVIPQLADMVERGQVNMRFLTREQQEAVKDFMATRPARPAEIRVRQTAKLGAEPYVVPREPLEAAAFRQTTGGAELYTPAEINARMLEDRIRRGFREPKKPTTGPIVGMPGTRTALRDLQELLSEIRPRGKPFLPQVSEETGARLASREMMEAAARAGQEERQKRLLEAATARQPQEVAAIEQATTRASRQARTARLRAELAGLRADPVTLRGDRAPVATAEMQEPQPKYPGEPLIKAEGSTVVSPKPGGTRLRTQDEATLARVQETPPAPADVSEMLVDEFGRPLQVRRRGEETAAIPVGPGPSGPLKTQRELAARRPRTSQEQAEQLYEPEVSRAISHAPGPTATATAAPRAPGAPTQAETPVADTVIPVIPPESPEGTTAQKQSPDPTQLTALSGAPETAGPVIGQSYEADGKTYTYIGSTETRGRVRHAFKRGDGVTVQVTPEKLGQFTPAKPSGIAAIIAEMAAKAGVPPHNWLGYVLAKGEGKVRSRGTVDVTRQRQMLALLADQSGVTMEELAGYLKDQGYPSSPGTWRTLLKAAKTDPEAMGRLAAGAEKPSRLIQRLLSEETGQVTPGYSLALPVRMGAGAAIGAALPAEDTETRAKRAGVGAAIMAGAPGAVGVLRRLRVEVPELLRPPSGARGTTVQEFVRQTVQPAAEKVRKALDGAVDGWLKLTNMGERTPGSRYAKGVIREAGAKKGEAHDVAVTALADSRKLADSMWPEPVGNVTYLPTGQFVDETGQELGQWRFMQAVATGKTAGLSGAEQKMARKFREMLDSKAREVAAVSKITSTKKLDIWSEDYFKHWWKAQEGAPVGVSPESLTGSEAVFKTKKFPTPAAAIQAGRQPVMHNPVDLMTTALTEMDAYVQGTKAIQELTKQGLMGTKAAKGWKPIGGEFARNIGYSSLYAPEAVADLINDYLAPSLMEGPRGEALSWALRASNAARKFGFGMSAVHAEVTAVNSAISQLSLGLNKLAVGDVKGMGKELSRVPIMSDFQLGNLITEEVLNPGRHPELRPVIDATIRGGARLSPDFAKWGMQSGGKLTKALRSGNVLGALGHAPGAALEKAPLIGTDWIFGKGVQPMKNAALYRMAEQELERLGPEANAAQIREAMGKLVDEADNRFGMVIYDNLFMNRMLKDLMVMAVQAPGWTLGTERLLLGGAKDSMKAIGQMLKGETPELTHRMAFDFALPVVVGGMGGVYTFLNTGEMPHGADFFYPRTGKTNPDGTPQRVMFVTYMRDALAHQPGKFAQFVTSKANRLATWAKDLAYNEDYSHTEIVRQTDPSLSTVENIAGQAKDVAQFTAGQLLQPLSVSTFERLSDEPLQERAIGAAVGLKRVTGADRTPDQVELDTLVAAKLSRGPKTASDAEKLRIRKELQTLSQQIGQATDSQERDQLLAELTTKTDNAIPILGMASVDRLFKESDLTRQLKEDFPEMTVPTRSAKDLVLFRRLPVGEALRVYEKADVNKRKIYHEALEWKFERYLNEHYPEDLPDVDTQIQKDRLIQRAAPLMKMVRP